MSVYCKVGGLKAFVDGYVVNSYGETYCLSLFGAAGAVRAVSAAFVSGSTIDVWEDGSSKALSKKWDHGGATKYRIFPKRLPSGYLNSVVVTESAFLSDDQQFVIITRGEEEPVELFFQNVVYRSEIPLHASWAKWLWQQFIFNDWITKLDGFRMTGYEVGFDDSDLAEAVSEGIIGNLVPSIE